MKCTWALHLLLASGAVVAEKHDPRPQKQPNILFILSDDQDAQLDSMKYMPLVNKHLTQYGTTYKKHYCTVAVCCPSRVNLLTGKAAHNTNVTDIKIPYGGYPKFVSEGWNENYLPVWMQQAGYNTYYAGKLLNGQTVDNYNAPLANGFNGSDFLLDPYTYRYWNTTMTRNGAQPVSYKGNYSTDIINEKLQGFLDEALSHDAPWFAMAAPVGPHAEVVVNETEDTMTLQAPSWPERHDHLFRDAKVPRDPSFNYKSEGAPSWLKDLPELNETVVKYHDDYYGARLRSLQSVDELVDAAIKKLDTAGVLDTTYILYSADNGYHIGQHRMIPGKECGYETDINVPLIIRGPGVPHGQVIEGVTSHTDITPTLLNLAGVHRQLDGRLLPLTASESRHFDSEHAAIEYWGQSGPEGRYGYLMHDYSDWDNRYITGGHENNTYKSLRLAANDYSLYYSVWCTNEHELYDMVSDPSQIKNLAYSGTYEPTQYHIQGRPLDQIIARLDALMMVLKSCKEIECTEPWRSLHPDGSVRNLKDALNRKFDQFYEHQPKVSFDKCELGYLIDHEGPQKWHEYHWD